MDSEFWMQAWANNQIPFHQREVNPDLKKWIEAREAHLIGTIFVPLCGKSLDMILLRERGARVIGVELSPVAVQAFFQENKLDYEVVPQGKCRLYRGESIEIWQGDLFDLPRDSLREVSAFYDRASLVALPKETRQRYARHLMDLLPWSLRNLEGLLITMKAESVEIQDEELQLLGPPYSIEEQEINQLWGERFFLEKLREEKGEFNSQSQYIEAGIKKYLRQVFHLRSRPRP